MAKKKNSKPEHELPYEVGKWKPPAGHRFKPGVSGNPRGRPRGSKNIATQIAEVLIKPVALNVDGKAVKLPAVVASTYVTMGKALKGDERAARAVMALAAEVGLLRADDTQPEPELTSDDAAALASFIRRVRAAPVRDDEGEDTARLLPQSVEEHDG